MEACFAFLQWLQDTVSETQPFVENSLKITGLEKGYVKLSLISEFFDFFFGM